MGRGGKMKKTRFHIMLDEDQRAEIKATASSIDLSVSQYVLFLHNLSKKENEKMRKAFYERKRTT